MTRTTTFPPQRLWSTEDVAEYIGRPPRTIAQWRYLNRGPRYISLENGYVRYRAEDVEAWLESQLRGGPDAA